MVVISSNFRVDAPDFLLLQGWKCFCSILSQQLTLARNHKHEFNDKIHRMRHFEEISKCALGKGRVCTSRLRDYGLST